MHDLFKSIVDDFTSLPAKVAAAQAKASEANVSNEVAQKLAAAGVFKGFEGLEGLLDAQDFWDEQSYGTRLYYGAGITEYLHRDVLRAAVEILRQPDYRQTLTDLVALVERIHDGTEGRWPAIDINCAVCTQGCAPSSGVCAWHAAKRLVKSP
jgi:hypothetical protein